MAGVRFSQLVAVSQARAPVLCLPVASRRSSAGARAPGDAAPPECAVSALSGPGCLPVDMCNWHLTVPIPAHVFPRVPAAHPRRLLISVDNSDASEAAVKWAMQNL